MSNLLPTPEELRAAIAIIAETHPEAGVLRAGVADAHKAQHPEGPVIYLSESERDALAAGDPYVTWVVTFRAGDAVSVAAFSSRACATGVRGRCR